ncbi:MAG TPA: hypothetical protein PK181_11155, partial [Methanothrix soehngenii]|nr:hypothetical protein [Methanothrix soehngenii]
MGQTGNSGLEGGSSFGVPYQEPIAGLPTSSFGQPYFDGTAGFVPIESPTNSTDGFGMPYSDPASAIHTDADDPEQFQPIPSVSPGAIAQSGVDDLISIYTAQQGGIPGSGSGSGSGSSQGIDTVDGISNRDQSALEGASADANGSESGEMPGWLQQALAKGDESKGGNRTDDYTARGEAARAEKAESNAAELDDSQRIDFDSLRLKTDLNVPDPSSVRWQELQDAQQRLADTVNAMAQSAGLQAQDIASRSAEMVNNVMSGSGSLIDELDAQTRYIRELEEAHKQQSERDLEIKLQHEKLELLASQKAKHKEDEKDAKEREEEKQRRLAEEMATML